MPGGFSILASRRVAPTFNNMPGRFSAPAIESKKAPALLHGSLLHEDALVWAADLTCGRGRYER